MKTLTSTFLAAIIIAFMSVGCSTMDDSPISEEAQTTLQRNTDLDALNDIIANHREKEENGENGRISTSKPTYNPGQVHIPVVGCDTMNTDLAIAYGDQNYIKIGNVMIVNDPTDLYIDIDPYAGLKITQVSYYEDASREGIPLDRNGTPDYANFPNTEEFANGKPTHTVKIPLAELNKCQAYAVYIRLATMNGPNGQPKYFDAWAWGHDAGNGYIMEICIPECGGGQIQQI